jgi:hypothetical protein
MTRGKTSFRMIYVTLPALFLIVVLAAACSGPAPASTTSTTPTTSTMTPASATSTTSLASSTTPADATPTMPIVRATTPVAAATHSASSATKQSGRQGNATAAAQGNDALQSLSPYLPALKNQLAQGLHLTTTQLTQKVQAGQTLTTIANAQGLSSTQLSALIASAVSTSFAPAVKAGQVTQQQVAKVTRRLQKNPNQLDTALAQ